MYLVRTIRTYTRYLVDQCLFLFRKAVRELVVHVHRTPYTRTPVRRALKQSTKKMPDRTLPSCHVLKTMFSVPSRREKLYRYSYVPSRPVVKKCTWYLVHISVPSRRFFCSPHYSTVPSRQQFVPPVCPVPSRSDNYFVSSFSRLVFMFFPRQSKPKQDTTRYCCAVCSPVPTPVRIPHY